MDSKAAGFCSVVAVLGIIAAVAGFAGEATRVKATDVYYIDDTACVFPSSPSRALGIVAAVFTIIARVYISVTFGACRCFQNDPNSTPLSKLLAVLSWVASVIAVILLLTAAAIAGSSKCVVVKPGIFAAGAILSLLSAALGIAAYVTLAPATQTTVNPAVAFPVGTNVDPEKGPVPFPPQQYPPQQYPPQQQY